MKKLGGFIFVGLYLAFKLFASLVFLLLCFIRTPLLGVISYLIPLIAFLAFGAWLAQPESMLKWQLIGGAFGLYVFSYLYNIILGLLSPLTFHFQM